MQTTIEIKRVFKLLVLFCLLSATLLIPLFSDATQVKSKPTASAVKETFFTIKMRDSRIVIEYDSTNLTYEIVSDDRGQAFVEVPGAIQNDKPGAPVLPVFNLKIALPPDVDMKSVKVEWLDKGYNELPGMVPLRHGDEVLADYDDELGKIRAPYMTRAEILNQSNDQAIYPASPVWLEGIETMRKWIYADLHVYPFGFNEEEELLAQTNPITITITYNRTGVMPDYLASDTFMDDLAKEILNNYADVEGMYLASPEGTKTGVTLAIITRLLISGTEQNPNTQTGIWEYANWLNSQGLTTIVLNDIDFNEYTGSTIEEKAKRCLQARYQLSDIGYVLLIGDPRSPLDASDINGNYRLSSLRVFYDEDLYYDQYGNPNPDAIPAHTDRWWSNLDTYTLDDWDVDGDGIYGEFCGDYYLSPSCTGRPVGTGARLVPDVYVGRLPIYNNSTGAQNNLRGVLRATKWFMLNENTATWRKQVLEFGAMFHLYDYRNDPGCGDTCGDKGDTSYWIEQINGDILAPRGHSTRRIYEHGETGYESDFYYDYDAFCNETAYTHTYCEYPGNSSFQNTSAIIQIRGYDAGLMFWFGHGSRNQTMRVLWDDLNSNGIPQGGNCSLEEAIRLTMIHKDEVLDPSYAAKYRRFFAFLGSCNNTRWDHTATDYNLAEALLGRYAVAAIGGTHVLFYRPNTAINSSGFMMQDIAYKYANKISTYIVGRLSVGKAVYDANSPTAEYPGIGTDNEHVYANMLHMNLLGDPRVKLKGNL